MFLRLFLRHISSFRLPFPYPRPEFKNLREKSNTVNFEKLLTDQDLKIKEILEDLNIQCTKSHALNFR